MEKGHLYEASYLVNHGIDEAVRGVQSLKWAVGIGEPRVSRNTPMKVQLLQEAIELNQASECVVEGLKRMGKMFYLQLKTVREERAEVVLAQIDFNRVFFRDFHRDYEEDEKWVTDFQRSCLAKQCEPEGDYIGVRQREEPRNCREKAARNRRKEVLKPRPKRNARPGDLTPTVETNGPRGTEAQS